MHSSLLVLSVLLLHTLLWNRNFELLGFFYPLLRVAATRQRLRSVLRALELGAELLDPPISEGRSYLQRDPSFPRRESPGHG